MSAEPQSLDLIKPESRYEATKAREGNKDVAFPFWENHLLCDHNKKYPAELNEWERTTVETETKRTGFCFWYRNPQQPGQSSLGIAYTEADQYKIIRPDFIFFAEQNGKVVVDLVDPHSIHLADALPKLRGLVSYAEMHGNAYRRIESVAEVLGKLRVLDLTRADVRQAITAATSAKGLYEGTVADDYA